MNPLSPPPLTAYKVQCMPCWRAPQALLSTLPHGCHIQELRRYTRSRTLPRSQPQVFAACDADFSGRLEWGSDLDKQTFDVLRPSIGTGLVVEGRWQQCEDTRDSPPLWKASVDVASRQHIGDLHKLVLPLGRLVGDAAVVRKQQEGDPRVSSRHQRLRRDHSLRLLDLRVRQDRRYIRAPTTAQLA